MKVSKAKKEQTRRDLITTAVELFSEKGYNETTMKQIARAAGVGDATIYKYFPSKEKLLLAYFEVRAIDAIAATAAANGFENYELHEKLQLLVDTYLESLLPDREFVAFTVEKFTGSPLFMMHDVLPVQNRFREALLGYLNDAEESGELPSISFKESIANTLGEYVFGVVFYWLKDDSEEFSNTTQLVDLSLGIVAIVLKSGLINKVAEFAGFIIKAQLYRLMENSGGLIAMLKGTHSHLSKRYADEKD